MTSRQPHSSCGSTYQTFQTPKPPHKKKHGIQSRLIRVQVSWQPLGKPPGIKFKLLVLPCRTILCVKHRGATSSTHAVWKTQNKLMQAHLKRNQKELSTVIIYGHDPSRRGWLNTLTLPDARLHIHLESGLMGMFFPWIYIFWQWHQEMFGMHALLCQPRSKTS